MIHRFSLIQLASQFLVIYNLILLSMKKSKIKHQWSEDEKKILLDQFHLHSVKKWKYISLKLKESGFYRSELECREKWVNSLDPNLNNEDWSPDELQRMYQLHDKHGNRWCFIQKQLNRTQNSIKNKFYGTIRNYIRLILNTICQKHCVSNSNISKIPPSLLHDIYHSQSVFDFMRGEVKKMIYRMRFCIDKKMLTNRVKERYPLYKQLMIVISNQVKNLTSFKYKVLEQSKLINKVTKEEIINMKIATPLKNKIKQKQESEQSDQQSDLLSTIKRCIDENQQYQSGQQLQKQSPILSIKNEVKQENQLDEANQNQLSVQMALKNEENYPFHQVQQLQNLSNEPKIKQEYVQQGITPSEYYPFIMQNSNYRLFDCYDPIFETVMLNNMAQQRATLQKIFLNPSGI